MVDTPDEPEESGQDAGSSISQDDLDALLAGASEMSDVDDSDALGSISPDEASEFGIGDDIAGIADQIDDPAMGFGNETATQSPFGTFGAGAGDIDFASFSTPDLGSSSTMDDSGMTRVRDIPLDVTVELGRTRLLIRDILDLAAGSIIELDKIAGEPVDLFANGLLVARGEVIVIDDNFGVRLTEIITAEERLKAEHEHSKAA